VTFLISGMSSKARGVDATIAQGAELVTLAAAAETVLVY